MADILYVANGALDLVGQGSILSIEDSTPAAKKAKLHIYQAIREVLAADKWKCAKGLASLALLTAEPAFGFACQYQLPNDYVRMVSFNDNDPDDRLKPLYDIQGRLLLTDETVAELCYVKDLGMAPNDLSQASPYLIDLFVIKLASKLAWPMQQSRVLMESLEQKYLISLRSARGTNAKETRDVLVNPASESTWIRARFTSTNG